MLEVYESTSEIFIKMNCHIEKLNEIAIDSIKETVATLFYRNIVKYSQCTLFNGKFDDNESRSLHNAFLNIRMAYRKEKTGAPRIISFLNEIYGKNDTHSLPSHINDELNEFNELLEDLESIKSLFAIKIDGERLFPIGNLLSNVLIDEKIKLNDKQNFRATILALQIFSVIQDKELKQQYLDIAKKYNIEYINYFIDNSPTRIGGNNWKSNYERNGVIVLHHQIENKILIRSTNKDYFRNKNVELSEIKEESDSTGSPIGFYYEYSLDIDDRLVSFDDIIKMRKINVLLNALELIIDYGYYNSFYDKAFVIDNEKITASNIFASNDSYISFANSEEKINGRISLSEPLNKYNLLILKEHVLDCITLGFLVKVVKTFDIDFCTIRQILSSADSNFQNVLLFEILKKINVCDHTTYLNKIYGIYSEDLKYVANPTNFIVKKYVDECIYPIAISQELLDYTKKQFIKYQPVIIKKKIIKSKILFIDSSENEIKENFEDYEHCFHDPDAESNEHFIEKMNEIFALCDKDNKKLLIGEGIHTFYKLVSEINQLNESLIPFETLNNSPALTADNIHNVMTYMCLHDMALMEPIRQKVHFEDIAKFRIINNLLCYGILPDKFAQFMKLLTLHDIVKFSEDNISDRLTSKEPNELFVLKDPSRAQSVLKFVFNNYATKFSCRNDYDPFDPIITKISGKYYINGEEIRKITFITDIIESGSSTRCFLRFHLEEPIDPNLRGQTFEYIDTDGKRKSARVREIVEANAHENNEVEISLLALYSSYDGKNELLNNYVSKCGFSIDISNIYEISQKQDETSRTLIKSLYGNNPDLVKNMFLVLREFNQTKKNPFPPEMLDPTNIVALFSLKRELSIKQRVNYLPVNVR